VNRLLVKITCGAEAPERYSQAVTVAATAHVRRVAPGRPTLIRSLD